MYYYFGENRMHQIADAIREKLGIERGIMASEMPMMIRAIGGSEREGECFFAYGYKSKADVNAYNPTVELLNN